MANAIFSKAREAWAGGNVNWGVGTSGDNIFVDLIDVGALVSFNVTTTQFRSQIATAARIATFGPLTGKALTNGVLDANDFTFTAVTGNQSEALIFWQNTGSDATSRLLIFVDTVTSGLPVIPNGGDVNVVLNAAGIATL